MSSAPYVSAEPPVRQVPSNDTPNTSPVVSSGAPAIQVLLVEDEQIDAALLGKILDASSRPRFRTARAAQLSQALQGLAAQRFDVVLLDLVLPDSTGLDTLTTLRRQVGTVPIVILSALDEEEFRLRAVQAGAQDYLVKGQITPAVLVRAIRYAIERKHSEEALHASEERFRSAFDYAGTGMALVSPEGRWLQVNRALCQMLGYPEHELLAQNLQLVIHAEDLPAHWQHLHKLLGGQIPYYQVENRCLQRSGNILWVLLSVSCVQGAPGEQPYFIFQLQDITARKQAEAVLRATSDQALARSRVLAAEDEARQQRLQERYRGPWEALWQAKQALEWALHRGTQGTALNKQEITYLNTTLTTSLATIKHTLTH